MSRLVFVSYPRNFMRSSFSRMRTTVRPMAVRVKYQQNTMAAPTTTRVR